MFNFFHIIAASTNVATGVVPIENDFIPVVFELSQSNGGQAEVNRLALTDQITAAGLTKLVYNATPIDCRMWKKASVDNIDNGVMQDMSAGVNTTQYDASANTFGAEIALSPLLKQHTANKVYYIKAMYGGSALRQSSAEDWNAASVGDLLDNSLANFATPAIRQIIIDNPGKTIKVALLRHQGESDDTDLERNAYYANSVAFLDKIRNYRIGGIKHFLNSPFLDTLLYYRPAETQEQLLNDLKIQFAAEQPDCYTVDIRNQPRKIDLTAAQKGGFSPTLSDNEHSSYLSQLQKGESAYDVLKNINWI